MEIITTTGVSQVGHLSQDMMSQQECAQGFMGGSWGCSVNMFAYRIWSVTHLSKGLYAKKRARTLGTLPCAHGPAQQRHAMIDQTVYMIYIKIAKCRVLFFLIPGLLFNI